MKRECLYPCVPEKKVAIAIYLIAFPSSFLWTSAVILDNLNFSNADLKL